MERAVPRVSILGLPVTQHAIPLPAYVFLCSKELEGARLARGPVDSFHAHAHGPNVDLTERLG